MKKWIMIVFALLVVVSVCLYWINKKNLLVQPSGLAPTITTTPIPTTAIQTPTEEVITYEGSSPEGHSNLIEGLPVVNGEQGYVAFPKSIEKAKPPGIVIYYHGSGQRITKNFSDLVMKNMRAYGTFFASRNMAFVASNQHGDNQGNQIAVIDSDKLINWVKSKYLTSNDIFVIGFSMGGKPAMRHVLMHPNSVRRIALLAPAQQIETYTSSQIKYFRTVELKVWHGTADVNVPYWVTEELVSYFKKNNTPIEVVTLKGKTHWDVDTEYMQEIFKWFVQGK